MIKLYPLHRATTEVAIILGIGLNLKWHHLHVRSLQPCGMRIQYARNRLPLETSFWSNNFLQCSFPSICRKGGGRILAFHMGGVIRVEIIKKMHSCCGMGGLWPIHLSHSFCLIMYLIRQRGDITWHPLANLHTIGLLNFCCQFLLVVKESQEACVSTGDLWVCRGPNEGHCKNGRAWSQKNRNMITLHHVYCLDCSNKKIISYDEYFNGYNG